MDIPRSLEAPGHHPDTGELIGPEIDIFLDDELLADVIRYDCSGGECEVIRVSDDGEITVDDDGNIETEVLRGTVTVAWKEGSPFAEDA